ncbi:dihydrolipoamide acetyltransferase family protein [Streptomyces sp. RPA4-2]|uniref:dihydrolipoamide acetyltransferase family protein n=1 Tax=Streptomyces sp. RPA4-2 TaxID=2721244 RepID=UPI00143ECEB0|nr:dihydrolipoamide acetyltransferase family protein [Streptomyces sp. RPA4-2]QIY66170.1 2-oxo acid dehydrogenase subunit E2 [Streptomyces sp. RPA4-2]
MATLLRMPEVAAGATEAVLSDWLVKEDTPFTTGDPIALIETDKASVEVAAETDAVILRILVPAGTLVEVGSPVALLGGDGDQPGDADRLLAELQVGDTPPPRQAPERREVPEPAPVQTTSNGSAGRIFSSPLARKRLKEAGLTPDQVRGTGPNGRIVRGDVEAAIASARQSAPAPAPARAPTQAQAQVPTQTQDSSPAAKPATKGTGTFHEIQHTRLRRAIAERLTASKQTIPHFYVKRTARVDALLALRAQLNEVSPHKISVNDLVLRAVAVAHRAVPEANVIWTDDALRQFDSVDVGVAIAGERGLVTPVLRGVDKASPSAIAGQVREFVRQAGDGTLRQSDLEGGSITVTNLGMFGVDEFSAIINPPQSAILAVGAGSRAPIVVDDRIEIATQLSLVLSVDHRAIDGAPAARWMSVLVHALEEPFQLIA